MKFDNSSFICCSDMIAGGKKNHWVTWRDHVLLGWYLLRSPKYQIWSRYLHTL